MVQVFSLLAAGSIFSVQIVNALPIRFRFSKRVSQVISDATQPWVQACEKANGGSKCNELSINAFGALLSAAGPCSQQDAADKMIDLAKELKNDPKMIQLTQVFAQQPRDSADGFSVLYCQNAPKNKELNGLFQCQFETLDPKTFTGKVPLGQPGTMPLGKSTPLDPAGSCPANKEGTVPDGMQLVAMTQDPGLSNAVVTSSKDSSSDDNSNDSPDSSSSSSDSSSSSTDSSSSSASPSDSSSASATSSDSSSASATPSESSDDSSSTSASSSDSITFSFGSPTSSDTPEQSDSASSTSSAQDAGITSPPSLAGKSVLLQNGKDAQDLNKQFATLSKSDSCQSGENACIDGAYAKCENGQFVATACPSGLVCVALPKVNGPGTSIACEARDDALSRILATGATGGMTGDDSSNSSSSDSASASASSSDSASESDSSSSDSASSTDSASATESATITDSASATASATESASTDSASSTESASDSASDSTATATATSSDAAESSDSAASSTSSDDAPTPTPSDDSEDDDDCDNCKSDNTSSDNGSDDEDLDNLLDDVKLATKTSQSTSDFKLQNGLDAQKLNKSFATLSKTAPCTSGQVACTGGQLAQCVNGKFKLTSCGSGLTCVALPLVNSRGTSVTCDTQVDAETRIAATGAKGGLTG